MDEEVEYAWDFLNEYVSSMYADCSSLHELMDGFGYRRDRQNKEIWEVIKDGLDEYDKEIGRL